MSSSPRLWPNPPGNSPLPLPSKAIFFSSREISDIQAPKMPEGEQIGLSELREFIGEHTFEDGSKVSDQIDVLKCRPLLIAGELANPYRLCDIAAPKMPIIPVRLENICRTWADNLDARDISPGIHHVTIVRSPGWWENTFITLLEPSEMKRIVQWLDGSRANTWAPKRLAEGIIRLESDLELRPPSFEQLSWDGVEEKVIPEMPKANGPALDLATIMVPINTRIGCYNSRGRVNRCSHFAQTEFHENMFRRGSSFKWSDMINCL